MNGTEHRANGRATHERAVVTSRRQQLQVHGRLGKVEWQEEFDLSTGKKDKETNH